MTLDNEKADSRVASLAALLQELFPRGLLWGEQGAISAAQMLIARGVTVCTRCGEGLLCVEHDRGSRLGEPSPEGRGTPSEAQMQAAREGWSGNLPLPSDAELRVLIEAVNRAAWPDRVSPPQPEIPPQ